MHRESSASGGSTDLLPSFGRKVDGRIDMESRRAQVAN